MDDSHDVTRDAVDGPARKSEGTALLERMRADNLKLAAVADRLDQVKASIGLAPDAARQAPEEVETTVTAFFLGLRKLIEHRERTTSRIAAAVEDLAKGF